MTDVLEEGVVKVTAEKPRFRFQGRMPGTKDPRTRNKGIAAMMKALRRTQAEARQAAYRAKNQ